MTHHRYPRHKRIAKLIHSEIASALQRHLLEHPELGLELVHITLCRVDLTPDLSFARLYVTVNKAQDAKAQLKQLNQILPLLRYQLGQVTNLKKLPNMRFQLESQNEELSRLTQLLESVS